MTQFSPRHFISHLTILIVGLALGLPVFALPSDKEQPITIQSDQAERDEIKGTTTYSGRVIMEQGSMEITADKVVIYSERNKVSKVVATGKPATYKQKPAADEAEVKATAKTLEYQVNNATLFLLGKALLKQEGTSLSGDKIEYDVKKSVVRAGGTNTSGDDGRVRMVIPAKSLKN